MVVRTPVVPTTREAEAGELLEPRKQRLQRAFVRMSTSPEAFLALRSHFASSHALICISHWILGIGDRHLNNFMVAMETGGMIGIDFGHAFGSATQFLPVPELMPFRLTRQFINLMLPMKETGLMYSVMVHALRAFRSDPGLLTNTMDVFVKDPSFDWKQLEKLRQENGLKQEAEVAVNQDHATAPQPGLQNDELLLGHEKAPAFRDYVAVARGSKDHNVRAREPEETGFHHVGQASPKPLTSSDPSALPSQSIVITGSFALVAQTGVQWHDLSHASFLLVTNAWKIFFHPFTVNLIVSGFKSPVDSI
ncbi:DNA-dependent protein kinase catalytic subunit [Plecturocebus cupreus]